MAAYRFATTRLRGLHSAGRAADLQHALISALLTRYLGQEYAGLFADFEVRDSDTRDWFVDAAPAPVPVARLPEDDQRAVRARAADMIAAVRGLADRIESQGAEGRNVARVLRDATVFPPDDLWFYRGAPLIVNWGYSRDETVSRGAPEISAPIRLAPSVEPVVPVNSTKVPAAPPPEVVRQPSVSLAAATLLWLLFALTIGRLYSDLLPACGIKSPFGPGAAIGDCPTVVADYPVLRESVRLQRAVEQAELSVAEEAQACSAPLRHASLAPPIAIETRLAIVPAATRERALRLGARADQD